MGLSSVSDLRRDCLLLERPVSKCPPKPYWLEKLLAFLKKKYIYIYIVNTLEWLQTYSGRRFVQCHQVGKRSGV